MLYRLGTKQPVGELLERFLLVDPPRQQFLGAFALRDVTGNLGRTDDGAAGIHDRRDAQRGRDGLAVLGYAYCFVVLDLLTAADALEYLRLLAMPIDRNE